MLDDEFVMPFGKYKGEPLSEIPTEYLDWLLGSDNLYESTKEQIEDKLDRRTDWHVHNND